MQLSAFRTELRELFRLAIPLAAAQAGMQLMGIVDVAVLGRYGAPELAGAGLANAIFFTVTVIGIGIAYGVDPMISQALGAGDRAGARHFMWQGIWLTLIVTGVLTIPLVVSPLFLPLFGIERQLIEPASTFLLIRTVALAPTLLFFVLRSYLQAHHITRPMLVTMIVCNIVNFALDILFVFGGWGIPAMGAAGAALSTVFATFLEIVIVGLAVRQIDVAGADIAALRRWNGAEVMRALRLGLPIGLQLGAEIGIFALVGLLAGRIGTLALAAHQLVISLAAFTYTISLGVGAAGSVRVGLAIGAGDASRTRVAGYAALAGAVAVMSVAALAFAVAPRPLARLISDQENVIAASMPLFLVAAVFQLSDGIQAVGSGVLRGAGDTRYAFLANIVGHWTIGLPIALLLGFAMHMSIVGLWWGLCAGLTAVAVMLFVRFERLSSGEIAPI